MASKVDSTPSTHSHDAVNAENSNEAASSPRFTTREKWFIVILTSFVGLFSPFTANIYFPAIPVIARAFNKSTELINLTVTMYMVLQGVAPMVWGTVSDHIGRRPISAVCLLILSLSCVGLALVPTSDYWLLMLLRCLQAAGSASTIAIGAGVIGDISRREERGSFFGVFTVGPMVGPAVGPVIGGALSDRLGWRSIFWFLCISASICFIIILLFQPETLNVLFETGRDNVPFLYRPVIPIIGRKTKIMKNSSTQRKIPKNPFLLFKQLSIVLLLAISAIACGVFYTIIAPISTLFETTYPFLNETEIGLCFLAIGGGMLVGGIAMGRTLDWEYQTFKRKTEYRLGKSIDVAREDDFPLEQARLRILPYMISTLVAVCAGYGWCLQHRVNIAVVLVLHFIVGNLSIALMNATSTFMIDLAPAQSSSVTACNNLIRCTFSAVLVSLIDLMIRSLGVGWTYVLISGIALISLPLVYLAMWVGSRDRTRLAKSRET